MNKGLAVSMLRPVILCLASASAFAFAVVLLLALPAHGQTPAARAATEPVP